MSIVVDGTGKRVTGSGLASLSTAGIVMIGGWAKYNSSFGHGVADVLAIVSDVQGTTGTYHSGRLSATPQFFFQAISGGSGIISQGSTAWTDDAWHLWAVAFGPHDDTSKTRWRYLDGVLPTATAADTNSVTTDLDEICIPGAWGSGVPEGKYAETFVSVVTDFTQAQSLMDAMWNSGSNFRAADHSTVTAIRSMNYYWPLFDDLVSDLGSNTLTNVGTTGFDTGDHPSVSHSGGSVIIATCVI